MARPGEALVVRARQASSVPSLSPWQSRTRVGALARIRDVLRSLGQEIGRSTIQEILRGQGIEPAPTRKRRVSWKEFLKTHWGAIAAWDFFTVEVLTMHGLVRYHVLIVIDLATRRVEIGGIAHEPTGAWMMQVIRNLLDSEDGFFLGKTHLIMDRDPVFTTDVRDFLDRAGVQPVRLPARSPNLNAVAERFVLSIKSECLEATWYGQADGKGNAMSP